MAEAGSLRQIAHSRAPLSAWFGTLLLFMLFGVIVLALIGPALRTDNYEQTRAKKRVENLKTLREADAKALTTYGWIDQAKGSAHIPIDRAMQLEVTELAQKKPAAAYPVAPTPAPVSSAPSQPTPAASPAPSATPPAVSPTPRSATSSTNAPTPFPKAKENEGPQSEIRLQPAAAANPPGAKTGTQPGASATPNASPGPASGKPAASPTGTPNRSPAGSPLPVAGRTPTPS
jgi:outer membrane biosynthesis protein TonB